MGKSFLLVAFLLFLISMHATIVRADESEDKPTDDKKNPPSVPASKDLKPVLVPKDQKLVRVLEEDEGQKTPTDPKKYPTPPPKDDEGEEDEDEGQKTPTDPKKYPTPPPKDDEGEEDEDEGQKTPTDPKKNPSPVPAPKDPKPPKEEKPAPGPKPKPVEEDATNYDVWQPDPVTGQHRVYCKSKGACNRQVLTCPTECPDRKPKKNKKQKGCFINCGSKCEATCKWRRANCNGYGALCYDPRFVGGDGVMFYFHGGKGRSFALVSDTNLQINAHFIGNRPNGRSRDYTWVQSVAIMFDTHTLMISAKKVAQWDDSIDVLLVKWDGQEVTVPFQGDAEWKTNTGVRQVLVERTDDTNSVRVVIGGLVEIDMKAVPVTKEDDKAHNYQLPSDDAFAHFETQFKFKNLSDDVEGILGKTYRPGYVSPVKRGVAMPIMGGEDKYEVSYLTSVACNVCMFQKKPAADAGAGGAANLADY